jgi:tetratricopeptide (TPR) repeat protein
MTFHQAFYQKHGIKVTREGINRHKDAEQSRLENAILKATQNDFVSNHTVQMAEQAVQKYPDSEALKNHLYIAYVKTKQTVKAMACLRETIKKHPNYIFAVINLVNHHLHDNEVALANQLLTQPYDVRQFEQEEFIHHVVFISYYQAVVRLALAKKDQKTAEKYHRLMFDYDPTDKMVKDISKEILAGRFNNMETSLIAPSEREVESTPKNIKGWETSNKPPVFIHPEVQQLFEYNIEEMPEKVIKELLELPRKTLIQDLENVLADTIRRRDMYLSLDDWDDDTMNFPIHALYFLTELRAYESLPTVLNILRQDQEFLEYWFSDGLNDYCLPTIYLLGNNQLDLLKAFVLEPNNYYWCRGLATQAATQIALRQPERRAEVVPFFRDIARTHLNQADNDGLIDNSFLGGMMNDMLTLKSVELEQEMINLFQKGWIAVGECGTLEEILKDLHEPEDFNRIVPLPATIYEMYSGNYTDKIEQIHEVSSSLEHFDDPYNDYLAGDMFKSLANKAPQSKTSKDDFEEHYPTRPSYSSQGTVRHVEPKLGRNDPCHCGSGKKYKKCHGA